MTLDVLKHLQGHHRQLDHGRRYGISHALATEVSGAVDRVVGSRATAAERASAAMAYLMDKRGAWGAKEASESAVSKLIEGGSLELWRGGPKESHDTLFDPGPGIRRTLSGPRQRLSPGSGNYGSGLYFTYGSNARQSASLWAGNEIGRGGGLVTYGKGQVVRAALSTDARVGSWEDVKSHMLNAPTGRPEWKNPGVVMAAAGFDAYTVRGEIWRGEFGSVSGDQLILLNRSKVTISSQRSTPESAIQKHYPGGHSHDQMRHNGRGEVKDGPWRVFRDPITGEVVSQHPEKGISRAEAKAFMEEFGLQREYDGAKMILDPQVDFMVDVAGSHNGAVKIDELTSPGRGTGAIRLMREITDLADKRGVPLSLLARPFRTSNNSHPLAMDKLIRFYEHFGFRETLVGHRGQLSGGAPMLRAPGEVKKSAYLLSDVELMGLLGFDLLKHHPHLTGTSQDVHGNRINPQKFGLRALSQAEERMAAMGITEESIGERWDAYFLAATPEELEEGMKWYDEAHKLSTELAQEHGFSEDQTAAALSALSPQMRWDDGKGVLNDDGPEVFSNVGLARAAALAVRGKLGDGNLTITKGMVDERVATLKAQIEGKKTWGAAAKASALAEIDALGARWSSMIGTHSTTKLDSVTLGNLHPTLSKAPAANMVKALATLRASNHAEINALQKGPKARSFWSNIREPSANNGHVTIDAHMLKAGGMSGKLLQPKEGEYEVARRAAITRSSGSAVTSRVGKPILPHQYQAVVWTVRYNRERYSRSEQGLPAPYVSKGFFQLLKHLRGEEVQKHHPHLTGTPQDVHGGRRVGGVKVTLAPESTERLHSLAQGVEDANKRAAEYWAKPYEPNPDASFEGEFLRGPSIQRRNEELPGFAYAWEQNHDKLVEGALGSWIGDPVEMRLHWDMVERGVVPTGNFKTHQEARALKWELENRARPVPRALFRGSTPGELTDTGWASWTTRQRVAGKFVDRPDERVHILGPKQAIGIRISDYIGDVTNEAEWIAKPAPGIKPHIREWGSVSKMFDLSPGEQEQFLKHYPGGQGHDQMSHGRRGSLGASAAMEELKQPGRVGYASPYPDTEGAQLQQRIAAMAHLDDGDVSAAAAAQMDAHTLLRAENPLELTVNGRKLSGRLDDTGDADFSSDFPGLSPEDGIHASARINEGLRFAASITDAQTRMHPDSRVVTEVHVDKFIGRPYYRPGRIYSGPYSGAGDWAHEFAHHIEAGSFDIQARTWNFLERRTSGEKPVSMGKGYGKDEKAKRDRFVDKYVGKQYPRGSGSEVLSMGVQFLHRDPVGFARKDPDHFTFTVNTLRGVRDGDSR